MNLKRFEILLPLNYNDGGAIEPEKFALTHQELVRQFGATTVDTTRPSGTWLYRGTLYQDLLIRITVDSPEPEAAKAFLRQYKEVLKVRFEQLDIWIAAHDIELI
jgi:hypothetical protein